MKRQMFANTKKKLSRGYWIPKFISRECSKCHGTGYDSQNGIEWTFCTNCGVLGESTFKVISTAQKPVSKKSLNGPVPCGHPTEPIAGNVVGQDVKPVTLQVGNRGLDKLTKKCHTYDR